MRKFLFDQGGRVSKRTLDVDNRPLGFNRASSSPPQGFLYWYAARILCVSLLGVALAANAGFAQDQPSYSERKKDREAHFAELRNKEVTFSAEVWGYSRVFPLLDGLLQDISATQVAPVALNPNAPNGTSVDAIQQSLQLQLQYSQMAGVQNSAAAQAATASSNFQTNLAQQQTALMQQLSNAYAQVQTAQTNLNTLTASGTASATDITNATNALAGANANLTAVGTAITNFKNLAVPVVPASTPVAAAPTLPGMTASAIPTGVSGAAAGTTNAPSFPPTKQMDNQINILWDRLARLVGAMAPPESMNPDDEIFLVRFDTGIYPLNRNKELLEVNYKLTCGKVLDLFPRNAALNIVDDKYKDSAFGFGAVLSWFGVGGSVAYNREHLKASQLLGQSSYITGHGIGQAEFGWLYGIGLGDDAISPGPRNTFALIYIPKDCESLEPKIEVSEADWTERQSFKLKFPLVKIPDDTNWSLLPTSKNPAPTTIESIEFNRNEYDPTAGKPAPVTVRLTVSPGIDQQSSITVDGQLIQRVRDNFGRAITPTVSGTNGVLEASQFGINTWIPTSPTTILITLDSSQYGNRFPQILLSSPTGVTGVLDGLNSSATITVSGTVLDCDATRPCALPSLGVLKATPKNLGVGRWISEASGGKSPAVEKLCITVLDPEPGTSPAPASAAIPTVQVISDVDSQIWGADAEVYAFKSDSELIRLSCDPGLGSRLVCVTPAEFQGKDNQRPGIKLQVIDQHHAGGTSIRGTIFVKECTDSPTAEQPCRPPLIWKASAPKLAENDTTDIKKSKWTMRIELVNVDASEKVALGPFDSDRTDSGAQLDCSAGPSGPCVAHFTIPVASVNSVTDWMSLRIQSAKGEDFGHGVLANVLANIKPQINQISDDRMNWSGQNLVYESIRVGNSSPIQITCLTTGKQCNVNGKYGSTSGFLYFVASENIAFPFLQTNSTGASSGITYTPPKPATGAGNPGAPTKSGTAPTTNFNLNIPADIQKKFPVQAYQ
jgi:hypothetical protein